MFDDPTVQAALMTFLLALLGLLTAVVAAITPKVRTWLDAEAQQATAAGHGAQVETGKQLAQSAVLWAEQHLSGAQGAAKREAAAAWLYKLANERGFDLPLSDAEKLIEEAVRVMQATGLDVQATDAKRAQQARDAKGRFTKRAPTPTELTVQQ